MNVYQTRLFVFLLFALFLSSGCSSLQPLDSSLSRQEALKEIEIGDQLEIETNAGERRLINVSSISETHVESADEQFALAEIEIIAHRKPTMGEKAAAVTAAAAVGYTGEMLKSTAIILLILFLAF